MPIGIRTALLTTIALVAFAANSVLCRMALAAGEVDAATFTCVRIVAGAGTLWFLASGPFRARASPRSSLAPGRPALLTAWISALLLFGYAAPFSFAYLELTAGVGALILFGSVQATMLSVAVLSGERPRLTEWCGLLLASTGLIYLVLPGLVTPSLGGAASMAVAGACWALYTLAGRGSRHPLIDTRNNFTLAVPLALALALVYLPAASQTGTIGLLLAAASGALASGCGYAIWYQALAGLTVTRAAVVQLSVPPLAAIGGWLLLAEPISIRLAVASVWILGGVALGVSGRDRVSVR